MPVLRALLPFLTAALAAWVTRGTLAVADARGPRLGALPSIFELGIFVVLALAAAIVTRPSPARARPLFLSALLLLPWLPVPVPAAALIWTGPGMAALVWMAVAVAVASAAPRAARKRRWVATPRRGPIAATVIAFVLFLTGAWRLAPVIPGGDEPHYLIIAQSLLADGDLRIENNHARGDYAPYFDGTLKPDYLRRGRDGQIYSIHAPGLPVLIAPAYAVAGYVGVVVWLSAIAALGGALVWRLAWRITDDAGAAWLAWAAVVLSPPFFFHAFTVYPDGPAAVLALIGLAAVIRSCGARLQPGLGPAKAGQHIGDRAGQHIGDQAWQHIGNGAALAFLPWLHTRYCVIAFALAIAILWQLRGRMREAAYFLALPIVSAAAWFGFFFIIYGTFSPSAPYGGYTQSAASFILTGLPGLLFDQQFGIVAHAPIYVVAALGLWMLWRRSPLAALTIVGVAVPYLLLTAAYRMWWGGWSAPARFAVPVLLLFAVPIAVAWRDARDAAARALILTALAFSVFVTVVLAFGDDGRLVYNTRTGSALWLESLGRVVDLSAGTPSFIRDTRWVAIGHTAVWIAVFASILIALAVTARRRGWDRAAHALAVPAATGAAVMIALTAVWFVRGVPAIAPLAAQTSLLRRIAPLLVSLDPPRRLSAADLLGSLRLGTKHRTTTGGSVLVVESMPAGRYRLHLAGRRAASGRLAVHIGRPSAGAPPLAAYELRMQAPGPTPFVIDLPVDVALLTVIADDAARRSIVDAALEPVSVAARSPGMAFEATAAIRGGRTLAFLAGERVYVEPAGFWVGPQARATVALQSMASDDRVRLVLRNAPVANRVTIETPSGRQELELQPGETWAMPIDRASPIVISVAAESGFRPADHDPRSDDRRLLGVWIEFRD